MSTTYLAPVLSWLVLACLGACASVPPPQVIAPSGAGLDAHGSTRSGVVQADGTLRLDEQSYEGTVGFPLLPHPLPVGERVTVHGQLSGPDFAGGFYGHLELRDSTGALLLAVHEGRWEGNEEVSIKRSRVVALDSDECIRRRQHAVRFVDKRSGDSLVLHPGNSGVVGPWTVTLVDGEVSASRVLRFCTDPSFRGLRYVISKTPVR
ncbi:MAG: hypothetical protein ACRBN8_12195 [Nannocystales bacterium]